MEATDRITRAGFLAADGGGGRRGRLVPGGAGTRRGPPARAAAPRRRLHRGGGRDPGHGLERPPDARGHPRHPPPSCTPTPSTSPATASNASRRPPPRRPNRACTCGCSPRSADVPERDILEHLAETRPVRATAAQAGRERRPQRGLRVLAVRARHRAGGHGAGARAQPDERHLRPRGLPAPPQGASPPGRPGPPGPSSHGRLGYAAAQDDEVDWSLFDIVGIDYYSFFHRPADHVRELRRYLRWGKPLAITEFGTCAYLGAPETAGMGWDVVDHDKDPEEIKGHLVRSERTQADYISRAPERLRVDGPVRGDGLRVRHPGRPAPPRRSPPRPRPGVLRHHQDHRETPRATRSPAGTGNPSRPSTPWPATTPATRRTGAPGDPRRAADNRSSRAAVAAVAAGRAEQDAGAGCLSGARGGHCLAEADLFSRSWTALRTAVGELGDEDFRHCTTST